MIVVLPCCAGNPNVFRNAAGKLRSGVVRPSSSARCSGARSRSSEARLASSWRTVRAPSSDEVLRPTKADADKMFDDTMKQRLATTDANDLLYQVDASRDYNPAPKLETIRAHLLAVNSADDAVNPPELGVLEAGIARIPGARCVVLPATPQSLGHQSSMHAELWKGHLAEFLKSV